MSGVGLRQLSSALLAATALLSSTCHAVIHQELTPMLLAETFDYIVVGGGASGAVLANRLSEDSNVSVLLVEAGSSDFNNSAIELPAQAAVLHNTQFDWNFTTTPQASFDNRSLAYPRGHVLGGSTAINQMAFCRGSKDDYDRWAQVTNDSGWSWDTLFPYFLNLDRLTTPADHHNTTGQFNPAAHGQTGLLNTSLNGFLVETAPRSIAASAELSSQFPFNLDYNSGDTIGLSFSQATIFNGARFTSAHGYIVPALERPNLQIVVNSFVSRVLPTGSQDGTLAFRSIEVLNLTSNATVTVNATREVILSAGAVKSPHILLLSGIGNSTHISSSGIQPLVDLPDVGQNLQDHVFLTLNWNVTPGVFTLDQSRENATFAAEARAQWTATRTGPWTITGGDTWGWFRIPDNSSLFEDTADPSAGPTSAHYEFIVTDSFSGKTITPPATGNFFTMATNLIQPVSRGSITLASLDPLVHPTIDPNMLSAPLDMAILVEAVKAARTFMSANAWQGWITGEFGTFAEATTDEEIEAYVRANADSVDHVSGTVAMGRGGCTDSGCGALNPDLTVKGTSGLRVVDASAFPFIISGHTQGAAYILAERAADIIKAAA